MADPLKRALDGLTVLTCVVAMGLVGKALFTEKAPTANVPAGFERTGDAPEADSLRMDLQQFFGLADEGLRIGPEDARVVAVVFTAYSCGYCAELEVSLRQLRAIYPQHLSVVYKHFLPGDDRKTLGIHLGAECAQEQGRFMEYHDAIFEFGRRSLATDAWRAVAESIAVPDARGLARCVRGGAFLDRIARDTKLGQELGVVGTPTSFINGIPVVGAPPLEALDSIISRELDRGSGGGS